MAARKLGKASTSIACAELEVSAIVIRADGTREDLGVVSRVRYNWFQRQARRLIRLIRKV